MTTGAPAALKVPGRTVSHRPDTLPYHIMEDTPRWIGPQDQEPASRRPMTSDPEKGGPADLERLGAQPQPSLLGEMLGFLAHNKKWWLLPMLVMMGLFGLLIFLSGTSVAPFIYTLF